METVKVATTSGQLWPVDRFGRATNAGDRHAMTPLARRVARAMADAYRARLGASLHSVYLTGPAARGRPGALEAIGVLRMTATSVGEGWLEDAACAIRTRWPAAGRPSMSLFHWREVYPDGDAFSWPRFRIGVSSVCLAGRDLARAIAPQRLSVAAANAWIVRVRGEVDAAADRVSLCDGEDDIRREAREMALFLLAAGFALVMPHEAVYTEDADLQRDFIALNHPERSDQVNAAYEMATEPTGSAADSMHLLEGFGRWLADESERWLDKHNPQRSAALPA